MPVEFKYTGSDFEYTITVYEEETEYYEEVETELEEEPDAHVCNRCERAFTSLSGLKHHQTVKGHNDKR